MVRVFGGTPRFAGTSRSATPVRAPTVSHTHRHRGGEVPRGEKMLPSGTDPESWITEYALVYEAFSKSRTRTVLGPYGRAAPRIA